MPEQADMGAVDPRLNRQRAILHHFQAVFFRQRHDLHHVDGDADVMDDADGLGLGRDLRRHVVQVHVAGGQFAVHEHGRGAGQRYRMGRRDMSHGRQQNLVAGADAQVHPRQMQGRHAA